MSCKHNSTDEKPQLIYDHMYCKSINNPACNEKTMQVVHQKFFWRGLGGLQPPIITPLLPREDRRDPLEAFFEMVAFGVYSLCTSKPPP